MKAVLQLKDLEFAITGAAIHGWLYEDGSGDGKPMWSLEVSGESRVFGEGTVQQELNPRFYWDALPLDIDDWRMLDGFERRFDIDADGDAYEVDDGPMLYLCSHMPLPRFQMQIRKRDGSRFELHWKGQADANWDRNYGDNMPFEMRLPVPFLHQEVRFFQQDGSEDMEVSARTVMDRCGLRHDALRFSHWRRFRDNPQDDLHRLIRAFFSPHE